MKPLITLLPKLSAAPIPRASVKPGATRSVTTRNLCSGEHTTSPHEIPVALQRQVFAAYGISGESPKSFEVDYLITPELGGSDDIQNLWPQP
jgi:hypothetical protein